MTKYNYLKEVDKKAIEVYIFNYSYVIHSQIQMIELPTRENVYPPPTRECVSPTRESVPPSRECVPHTRF